MAWRRASTGDKPALRFSAVCNARWSAISSLNRSSSCRVVAQDLSRLKNRLSALIENSLQILRLHCKEALDNGRRLFPISRLGLQLFASVACQPVKARLAGILRGAPFGIDRTLLLQLQQDRIERALIYGEKISADLLDTPGDAVSVQRTEHVESFQHHQRQRALEDVFLLFHNGLLGFQAEAWHTSIGKATAAIHGYCHARAFVPWNRWIPAQPSPSTTCAKYTEVRRPWTGSTWKFRAVVFLASWALTARAKPQPSAC